MIIEGKHKIQEFEDINKTEFVEFNENWDGLHYSDDNYITMLVIVYEI